MKETDGVLDLVGEVLDDLGDDGAADKTEEGMKGELNETTRATVDDEEPDERAS